MKLEQQVVSLEIAKKLKELGVRQDSLFWWSEHTVPATLWNEYALLNVVPNNFSNLEYSAFTTSELGEMLPTTIKKDFHFEEWKTNFDYTIQYKSLTRIEKWFTEKTEADARGAMLVYLLENKLLPDNHHIQ